MYNLNAVFLLFSQVKKEDAIYEDPQQDHTYEVSVIFVLIALWFSLKGRNNLLLY